MKKFLFLTTAVFLLLAVSMAFYTPAAKADAPADFVVGIQKISKTGVKTPVLNAYVTIRTKGKDIIAKNGVSKTIPLDRSPYFGNHLDSDYSGQSNSTPDTNDLALYTTTQFGDWGVAVKSQLIWCGQDGGVPDGQFEAYVNIADQQPAPNLGNGTWTYQWEENYGGETYVRSAVLPGTRAEVQAVNPRQTSVWFTFTEAQDPPPPAQTYIGQIKTQKRMNDAATGNPFVTQQDLLNAKTQIYQANGAEFRCGNFSTCSSTGSPDWATGAVMWVNPSNVENNDNSAGYLSKIDVPFGYRVNRVQLSRSANAAANAPNLSCTDSNNTGTCSTTTKVWNQDTTFVDWFLEKIPPTLTVNCTPDNGAIGGYITVTASSNIPGDTNPVIIKEAYDSAAVQNRTLNAGSYTFDITSKYRDGGTHTYYATYGGLSKSVAFGPGQNCKIDKWFYPWLQTSQGDVVADGEIEGQTTSTGTGTLGARLDSATAKEAEFLVISAVGGGGPFCSTYKYILTNTSSQGTDCGNGDGYNFNSTGIDNDTVDRVIGGVKQAFADNGNNANSAPSACTTTKPISTATVTTTTMPAAISTDCTGGIIYKLSSSTLGATNPTKGRATIFVDGDLTITGDISSASSLAQADPRLAQTLAIVVDGNINIASTVSSIYAQLYSAKKINTCTKSTGTPANPATTNECSLKRLVVVGSLSAKTGFEFKRTFVDTAYQNSAERIKMTGIALAFPPPGIDSRYFYNNFSSYKLDSAEYNPRF